jgi:hypothetical protein
MTYKAVEIGWFLSNFAESRAAEIMTARQYAKAAYIARLQGENESAEYFEQAKKQSKINAPYVIPSALYYTTHRTHDPADYNNLLCIDIDRKDNPDISDTEWGSLPVELTQSKLGKYIAFIGESRSGWQYGGYFLLIKTDAADDWAKRANAVILWLQLAGIKADTAAANINHGRALTLQTETNYCKLPLVNPCSDIYTAKLEPKPTARPGLKISRQAEPSSDYDKAVRAVQIAVSKGIDICGTFETWTNTAFALANAFGENGKELFISLAAVSPKYKERENEYKWQNAMNTQRGSVGIGTFWHYMQQYGITAKGV